MDFDLVPGSDSFLDLVEKNPVGKPGALILLSVFVMGLEGRSQVKRRAGLLLLSRVMEH